jgi:hypothetical protein
MDCKHTSTTPHYGFARAQGFRGLGVQEVCEGCYTTLEWSDDLECNSEEEITHNKKVIKGIKDGLSQSKH